MMQHKTKINDPLGLNTSNDKMLAKTPTHALLEKVRTKLMNIKLTENAKMNLFLLLSFPYKSKLILKGITNARKLPKLFGFINTNEPNLPEA